MTETPVLRPIIGLDKEEIIRIAKSIDTYRYSIIPVGECKATPDKPVTKANLEDIQQEEEKIDIEYLVESATKKIEVH